MTQRVNLNEANEKCNVNYSRHSTRHVSAQPRHDAEIKNGKRTQSRTHFGCAHLTLICCPNFPNQCTQSKLSQCKSNASLLHSKAQTMLCTCGDGNGHKNEHSVCGVGCNPNIHGFATRWQDSYSTHACLQGFNVVSVKHSPNNSICSSFIIPGCFFRPTESLAMPLLFLSNLHQ